MVQFLGRRIEVVSLSRKRMFQPIRSLLLHDQAQSSFFLYCTGKRCSKSCDPEMNGKQCIGSNGHSKDVYFNIDHDRVPVQVIDEIWPNLQARQACTSRMQSAKRPVGFRLSRETLDPG